MWTVCACLFLAAQPGDDWQKQEAVHLKNTRQVTRDFVRAGEGYFSPDASKIIFQAEEKGENPFYQMFVMDLESGAVRRVSPGIGKTTCGYFHPNGKKIIFASSHLDPDAKKFYAAEHKLREEEKQTKKRRRYVWDFDAHMDIFEANLDGSNLKRLTDAKGYDAEGSYSADGKRIVFCSNRSGEKNLELYIMDADGTNVQRMTDTGYAVSPSWSPNGQLLAFAWKRSYGPGEPGGQDIYLMDVTTRQWVQLTHDSGTNDFPSWSPDGRHIVYESKQGGRSQLWGMLADGSKQHALTTSGENSQPNWSWK